MKTRYKISMNRSQKNLPPWKVEDESGKSHNVKNITITVPMSTEWDESGSVYRGWLIAVGELILDEQNITAKII